MLKIKIFTFNPFSVNTFVIFDDVTGQAVAVDPGMISAAEKHVFDSFIESEGLTLTQIVNTHLHLDHCFGDNYVRDRYGVKIAANADDEFLGNDFVGQCRRFGIMPDDCRPVEIDERLHAGDKIEVGSYSLDVIHIPGHSPGSIGLYSKEGNFVIVGDVLFYGGVGRTDLPGGNCATLQKSITSQLFTLPDKTAVFPGHGPHTTILHEKHSNPYTSLL